MDGDGKCRKRTQLSLPAVCLLSILSLNSLSSISNTATLFIYAAATASSLSPPPPPADKEVLLNLKSFLLQNNPIHRGLYSVWNASDPSHCHWPGISCNSHGHADGIDLHDSSISGGIFPNFSLLPALARLDLSSNTLSGPIPPDLSQCRRLRYLNLSHNLIGGRIPPEYGRISTLQLLDLSFNRLSGGIPPQVGYLTSLLWLMLANNELAGEIPPEIGNCSSLLWLNLANNRLTGGIPTEIYRGISYIQSLDISVNNFSGEFPDSLNGLSYLNKFNVSFNPFLRGIIPASGQIATFDSSSFIGDPLISFSISSLQNSSPPMPAAVPLFLFGIICWIFLCLKARSRSATHHFLNSYQDSTFPREESLAMDQLISSPPASLNPPSSAVFSGQHLLLRMNKMAAFTYPDIVAATLNFSADKLIGCGGYGEVYAGVLPDGRPVAIKKLKSGGAEGERAFRAEVETLGGGHPNLVALHGWCLVGSKKLLVYEYMPGGSLEDVIKDRHGFTWEQRVAAAVAVARALVYLHHECTPAVVHRDVKASNVMMDASGAVKLTDLGLARVVAEGRSHVSTVVAGTVGYVAPEYGQTWKATTKGDVYSFGVLVMELAMGRRAVEDGGEEGVVEWRGRVGEDGVMQVAAEEGWWEAAGKEVMRKLLWVGMVCTAEAPHRRPDMREVLKLMVNFVEEQPNK
ncbi:putative LRR receptor-like serine/threonine-protein kinase [Platanthera zijinensis]|uniref:non-specific serine/threonine protein kinase n=1 Tax=Platanthera zijinensis TaxID=2320716 RepID=A0AAP0BR64_9ASPA